MYESFTPLDDWTTRPRVMSYVRKGSGLQADQLRPVVTRDLIFLQIQARNSPPVTIINAYNAPPGCEGAGNTITDLISLPQTLTASAFLAGDFNLLHPRWDPYTERSSPLADPFTDWLDHNLFIYTSESGASTHARGNVLDLAFLAGPLAASIILARHMDTTADHIPLLTSINWGIRFPGMPKRLRINTLDQELFTALLEENCKTLSSLPASPTSIDLDQAATDLTQAISKALNGSAKRSLGQNTGYPWWDKDCTDAVRENRTSRTDITARALRNTVRKAKRKYWESKLDIIQEIKDIYKITK